MQDVLEDVFRCIAFGDLDICTKPSHSKFPTVGALSGSGTETVFWKLQTS